MREYPLLHAHYEDNGELQPLCGMKGHERHRLIVLVVAIDVRYECDLFEESAQRHVIARAFELPDD